MTTRTDYLAVVKRHVGDASPLNTCVSQGVSAWSGEAGMHYPEVVFSAAEIQAILGANFGGPKHTRANVTAIAAAAREGIDGYAWIDAADARPGDWLVWPDYDHISVMVPFEGDGLRSIGAGGPTGKVYYQPQNGGGNPAGYFLGAIRPPYTDNPAAPAPGGLPRTATEEDGVPGEVFGMRLQVWAAQHGYTGPIDGEPGPNTWAAVQRALAAYGYTGPDDGEPGPNTYAALQRLAAQHGYTGPIDGEPGPNTWRGLARFLNTL